MNFGMVLPAALIALAFVTWPIIGKYSGITGAWVGVLASVGTLTLVAVFSGRALATPPTLRGATLLLAAGAINGVAVFFYSMKTSDPQISTGVIVVITSMMMVVWAPILDRVLNGSAFSPHQIFGFGAAALAIYLLGR
ncbi:MAG: hypothetical protein AAB367_03545 [Patescibacteria group bacterium]